MFIHIFRYRLLTLLRDRTLIFWTMIFPVILATLFNLTLRNIGENEKFNIIDIAIVDDAGYQENTQFQQTIKELSEGEEAMFNLILIDEDTSKDKLLTGDIAGYILVDDTMKVVINQSGINQSIIKIFLDQYSQTSSAITNIIMENPSAMSDVLSEVDSREVFSKEVSVSDAKPDSSLTYFYSLIAMACLYGSFFGLREVTDIQANLSNQGARLNMAPVHKLKSFLYRSMASLSIQFVEMLILMAYLRFGLGIDFGSKIGLVILTVFVGSIVGIAMGAFIGAIVKGNENSKVGICIGATMTGSFLAGMMVGDIKYLVDKNLPIVSLLNPVNVLSDSFYALYYYDNYDRYILNIMILIGFSVVFCFITYLILRRKKYASI